MRGLRQIVKVTINHSKLRVPQLVNYTEIGIAYRPHYSFFKDKNAAEQQEKVMTNEAKVQEEPEQPKENEDKLHQMQNHYNKQVKNLEQEQAKLKDKLKDNEKLLQAVEKSNQDQSKKITELRENLKAKVEEFELFRTRMDKEKEQLKVFAISNFAKELLEVQDNLERAIESNKEKQDDAKTLLEGVTLTHQILGKTLSKFGVVKINPMGEKFNPNLQESLFQVEDADKEPGTVCFVAQEGYIIGERVLRPAKVGVVKQQ